MQNMLNLSKKVHTAKINADNIYLINPSKWNFTKYIKL